MKEVGSVRVRLKMTGRQYNLSDTLPELLELAEGASIELALEQVRAIAGPIAPGALLAVSGEHLGTVADHRTER